MRIPIYTETTYTHLANTLVHYVFVRDDQSSKLFANGVLVGTTTNASATSVSSTPFVFFAESPGGQWAFKGEFGSVKLWNSALSDNQCISLYVQEKSYWSIP